jgi:hypothetical protein
LEPATSPEPPRWQRWLYLASTGLLLLPLWTVPRVPTADGPCHLYTAWILRHLHDPNQPLIANTFQAVIEPVPNWLIQVLLYMLLGLMSPALAEKLLLSFYVLLFAGAAWYFAGSVEPRRRIYAFLALPFAYNYTVHYGFYNFVISLPLMLIAIGWWWRKRAHLHVFSIAGINLLLLLCYFAHMVALTIALLTIGLIWLLDFERAQWRRWVLIPLLLLPQVLLPSWYLLSHASKLRPNPWPPAFRWIYLKELLVLFLFPQRFRVGLALATLFALLVVVTLVRERRRESPARYGFLIAALVALGLYFFGPEGVGLGTILTPRLSLLPFLLVLPWLSGRLGRHIRSTIVIALALLVAWESASLVRWHRTNAGRVDAFLAGLGTIAPHRRLVALVFTRQVNNDTAMLGHAASYVAIEKGLVDWDNYQAATDYFPVRFRAGVQPVEGIETDFDHYDVARHASVVDYVYTWAMPADASLRPRLRTMYRLIAHDGEGALWRRKRSQHPASPASGIPGGSS